MIDDKSKKGLNLLIVAYYFPPDYSGAGKQFHLIAKELLKSEEVASVTVLSISRNKKIYKYEYSGVKVYRFPLIGKESQLINTLSFVLFVLSHLIVNLKNYNAIQFVNITTFTYLIIIVIKLLSNKIKLFARVSLLGSDDFKTIEKSKFGKYKIKILSSIDGIVSISEAISKSSKNTKFSGTTYNIPNGVDTSFYSPIKNDEEKYQIRKKLNINHKSFVASFSGAFIERKGFDFLIKSWEVFLKSQPNSVLILIGYEAQYDQAYDPSFFQKAKSNISDMDNYRFIKTDNVRNYLSCSDIFIFPSLREGVPNAVNEAKSCGLPVLVRKKEWVTDFLVQNEYDGMVLDTQSFEEFSHAINFLSNDKKLISKYGDRARKKVENKISISIIKNKYLEMYLKD